MRPTVLIETAADEGGPGVFDLLIALMTFMGVIAWPILIGLIVWWFREPLKDRIAKAKSLEGFGVKAVLDDAYEQAKEIEGTADIQEPADTLEATGTVHNLEAEGIATGAPVLGSPTMTIQPPSFERLAAIVPETAIMYQWGQIEERMIDLARVHHLPLTKKAGARLIQLLDAANVISPDLAGVLFNLNRVRNSAVHHSEGSSFAKSDVFQFRDTSIIVLK